MQLSRLLRRAARTPAVPATAPTPVLQMPRAAVWWILLAVVLVGATVGGTLWWLLADLASQPPAPPGQPAAGTGSARGEILRTALAAGAGVGAAITLALAFRRQRQLELHNAVTTRHAERIAAASEHDATERRVTDLYTKAAEQLGHDKAAVRLAGLYALERLAQDNPGHRQTIVNVICAYLRMPYIPPTLPTSSSPPSSPGPWAGTASHPGHGPDSEGERQVRLTAQTILADHLRDVHTSDERVTEPADHRFWDGMILDFTGATLINFSLSDCRMAEARFHQATFIGHAGFDGATFSDHAGFLNATFSGDAGFDGAAFSGAALFVCTTFSGSAGFNTATFSGFNSFAGATFSDHAWFGGATFSDRSLVTGERSENVLRFKDVVVGDPGANHVWPPGWHVEIIPGGKGRLVREAPDASGPSS
ncbi:pentapeptide repeat-containing protein [Acrocarpospora catenulata]|uniref:pentapeptide repeat-containing protein n=1 Tax=Acrocarpospora catenulata TaxID=2836182 RepID=UPI001BDB49FD|nr:pentapeptide repeat-containing protein [Acrocarpospora catenulata]